MALQLTCAGDTGITYASPRGRGKLDLRYEGKGRINLYLPGHNEGFTCNFDTLPEIPDYYRATESGVARLAEEDVIRIYQA
jgi:hypothetical protein